MDRITAALGDAARWRIVELLADRPRSVGELVELTGLRQPQTTKHLQTLARAGLVGVFPLGQRRVYALEPAPLKALRDLLQKLVDAAAAQAGDRDVIARYRAAIEAESAVADRDRWADGRTFSFERVIKAARDVVWRHWVDPDLLVSWWAAPSMTITACGIEPKRGGRVVLDYRDADGRRYRSAGHVHSARKPAHLAFDLSVLDSASGISFTGNYDVTFSAVPNGTRLQVNLRITDTTVEAVPYIAGIETGWDQVLDNLEKILTTRKGKRS